MSKVVLRVYIFNKIQGGAEASGPENFEMVLLGKVNEKVQVINENKTVKSRKPLWFLTKRFHFLQHEKKQTNKNDNNWIWLWLNSQNDHTPDREDNQVKLSDEDQDLVGTPSSGMGSCGQKSFKISNPRVLWRELAFFPPLKTMLRPLPRKITRTHFPAYNPWALIPKNTQHAKAHFSICFWRTQQCSSSWWKLEPEASQHSDSFQNFCPPPFFFSKSA